MKTKPKKKKLPSLKRLIKLAHAAWSKRVRARDGKCMMCDETENLQAHHAVVPASKGSATRFLLVNSMTLCYYDHRYKVHGGARNAERKDWYDKLKQVIDGMVTQDIQAKLIEMSHTPKVWKRDELNKIICSLENGGEQHVI